jgi:hypothetical protein
MAARCDNSASVWLSAWERIFNRLNDRSSDCTFLTVLLSAMVLGRPRGRLVSGLIILAPLPKSDKFCIDDAIVKQLENIKTFHANELQIYFDFGNIFQKNCAVVRGVLNVASILLTLGEKR